MVKRSILRLELFREIKNSAKRYFSLLFIVALGVSFYSGVRTSQPDMEVSIDRYYDAQKVMDLRIISTWGFTDDDVEAVEKVEGVAYASGYKSVDTVCQMGEDFFNLTAMCYTGGVNEFAVSEGRLPYEPTECLLDERFASTSKIKLGDTISLTDGKTDDGLLETLSGGEFTVVGFGSSPMFLTFGRGTCQTGDGTSNGFLVVTPDAFVTDYYTQLFVRVEGAEEKNTLETAYQDRVDQVAEQIEMIEFNRCETRYQQVYDEAQAKLDEAKELVKNGTAALDDAKTQLDDSRAQLDDAKEQLADAKKQLDEGWDAYEKGLSELEDGKKQYTEGLRAYQSGKTELEQGESTLNENKITLAVAKGSLQAYETSYESYVALADQLQGVLDSAKERLDAMEQAEEDGKATDDGKKAAKSDETAKADETTDENDNLTEDDQTEEADQEKPGFELPDVDLSDVELPGIDLSDVELHDLDLSDVELPDVELPDVDLSDVELPDVEIPELNLPDVDPSDIELPQVPSFSRAQTIAELKDMVDSMQTQMDDLRARLALRRTELDEMAAQVAAGEAQIAAAQLQISAGKATLAESELQLEEARLQLDAGAQELNSNYVILTSAQNTYDAKYGEYEAGEKAYEEGLAQYNEEREDALKQIADAREQIAEGEDTLADLLRPDWTIYDRNSIQTYVEFSNDSERIGRIGKIFPAIFFMVAALVALTTMTRMVEEQRLQIGTLKALGYSNGDIAFRYLFYALSATVAGSLLGVLAGEQLLPFVIMKAYGILYNGVPEFVYQYNLEHGLVACGLSIGCIGIATAAACIGQLRAKPAQLMRPEAPKSGKRLLIERITFLWKPLKFSQKATIRNLFRYKKRFFMTVFGIGGCMGLLLTGFGLRDSIYTIARYQFNELFMYDATISLEKKTADRDELDQLCNSLTSGEYDGVTDALAAFSVSADVGNDKISKSTTLFIPENVEKAGMFVTHRDRVSGKVYEFPTEGVTISEKLATLLEVGEGDEVVINFDEKVVRAKVAHVTENYVYHYLYMSPDTFEDLFGEKTEYSKIYLLNDRNDEAYESALGKQILLQEEFGGVSFTSDLNDNIDTMLSNLNMVVIVLIAAAGLLAFVVLFNLNNINITERRRELATIRVLGFYDGELAMYVYRENLILTLFGILFGIFFGIWLHSVLIKTVEVDIMMFGRGIEPISYLLSAVMTLLFAAIINGIMYFSLRKIDMIESLKSVE